MGPSGTPCRRIALLLACLAVLAAGCATAPPPVDPEKVARVDALLRTIRPLLDLAPAAAQATWPGGPRADQPVWEARLLDAAILRAGDHALPPEVVSDFLGAQFAAAKRVESALHGAWKAEKRPPDASPPDLERDVRARWVSALPDLLAALGRAWPVLRAEGGRELLERRTRTVLSGVPGGGPTATTAIAPLWQLAR